MKTLVVLALVALTGCAQFENRVYCSVAKDEAAFVSWYMKFGVAARVSEKDAPALCAKGAA